jgi:hypothetical protein
MLGKTVRAIIFANYDNFRAKYEVFHAVERKRFPVFWHMTFR